MNFLARVVKFRRGLSSDGSAPGGDPGSYEDVDLGTLGSDSMKAAGKERRNTAELASGFGSIVGDVGEVDPNALTLCEGWFIYSSYYGNLMISYYYNSQQ